MNEHSPTSTMRPKYITVTRVLFTFFSIYIIWTALVLVVNAVYYGTQPLDLFQFTDNGSSYYAEGPLGYTNLSYEYLAFRSSAVISNVRLLLVSVCLIHFLAYSIPFLLLMNTGRRLFKILSHSYTPFTDEVTTLLKRAGKTMIFIGIFSKLIFQVVMNIIMLHRFSYNTPYELNWLFTGVITLLLSGIFARGCQLQEEADTTL